MNLSVCQQKRFLREVLDILGVAEEAPHQAKNAALMQVDQFRESAGISTTAA